MMEYQWQDTSYQLRKVHTFLLYLLQLPRRFQFHKQWAMRHYSQKRVHVVRFCTVEDRIFAF
jgi:hypothetical protein